MIWGAAAWCWVNKQNAAPLWAAAFSKLRLFNLNIAGSGAYPNRGAPAVDDAADMMTIQAALHGDGLRDVDAARACIGVEVEVGVADGETDGPATCRELPVCGWLACGFDVATTSAGFEGSRETAKVNVSAAGFGFDIAGPSLLELNVT